jgi:acyl-coenzyme A synthetase/AMP-(fatty) acid ligase
MRLIDMIFYRARLHPHRRALIQSDLVITYQALADAIEAIASHVRKLNLERDQPVGVSIASPAYFIATVLGVLRSDHNVAMARSRLLPFLQGLGIRNLIYDSQGLMLSGGRNIRFDPAWITDTRQQPPAAPQHREDAAGADNLSLLFFTSGTTGRPKHITIPLDALDQRLQYPINCASGPGNKILIMPGLSSTSGFSRTCEILNAGKSACFAPDVQSALALIALHRIDVAVMSVAQVLSAIDARKANPAYRLDSLKVLITGGGTLTPEGVARIRATLCRNVLNHYGSTEAGVVALTPFEILDDQPGALPFPWTDVQVVDQADNPLPAGTAGIVRCRTPQLTESVKQAGSQEIPGVRNGWFYPGDTGTLGANGILLLAGRTSDVINRGGVKVSGTRIEEILKSLPQVNDAAACGVVGASGMEEVWVAVVPNGTVDIDAIKQLLRTDPEIRIAPDEVFILDELPRGGGLDKVQKDRLKELLLSRKKGA